jgi:hypothetical protein
MPTPAVMRDRWRYVRELMRRQLGQFERGELTMSTGGEDISDRAIDKLKQDIETFDEQIERGKPAPPKER